LLESLVQPGDVILIKGSRAMRMEEIVNALSQG
jgi:UDP-N-acetylmuramyl pentapeptide synthase